MKFEEEKIKDILRMRQEGKSLRRIAMKHGISHITVRNIIINKANKDTAHERCL